MADWRYNNETGFYYPLTVTEHKTVVFNDDWNDYGFQLTEAPQYVSGGGVSIVQYITGGATWIENPVNATPPAAGHFMVDYDAPGYEGTGRIRFNSADNGKTFTVSYLGLGRILAHGVAPFIQDNFRRFQRYTTAGSYTFTVPADVHVLYAIVIGAGGGGSCKPLTFGGSGGGGGVAEKLCTVSPGQTIAVTVGAGGIGGSSDNGTDGGSSYFGAVCYATGGKSTKVEPGPILTEGGVSGIGSGGDINYSLGDGTLGGCAVGSPADKLTITKGGGAGGKGQFGATAARNGQAPGAGGGGSTIQVASTAANGADGAVIILY